MSRNRAILLVTIATAVCAATLLLAGPELTWLRVAVGIPFALLLPGQATMLLVDPDGRLGGLESFALSVSVSISIAALAGMALASALGLTANGMVAALTAVTLLALAAARARTASESGQRPTPTRRNPARRAALGAAALLACALFVLALSIPLAGTPRIGQTVQLWGLPDKSGGGLRIGANNVNAKSQRYRLTIQQGGRLISEQVFDLPTGTSHVFEVKKSATWTSSAPVVAVLRDTSGVMPARTISVWTFE